MQNKLNTVIKRIEPHYWQESSRISILIVLAGWLSLYYTRITEAPVSFWWVWLFSVLTVVGSAYFGAHYRHTYENKPLILKYLIPGFLLLLLFSFQLLRYPHQWPFFGAMINSFTSSLYQYNLLPMDFWHIFYMLILVWRGLVIGRRPVSSESQQKSMLMFFFAMMAYQFFFRPQNNAAFLIFFSILFLIGLIGMPAARMVNISQLRGGKLPRVNGVWIVYILSFAVLLLGGGWIASLVFNLPMAKVLASAFISMFTGLVFLLFVIFSPIAYIIMVLLESILKRLLSGTQLEIPDTQTSQEVINQVQEQAQEAFHHTMLSMQNIVVIAVAVGIVVLIWLTLRNRAGKLKPVELEEGAVDKLAPPKFGLPFQWDALRNRLNLPPSQGLSAIRIRWIYATLCYYGKLLGTPRKPAITPLEYRSKLYTLFPDFQSDINELTSAYIAVRYGSIPEDPDEMHGLQKSWERLEKEARSQLQQKTKLKLRLKKD